MRTRYAISLFKPILVIILWAAFINILSNCHAGEGVEESSSGARQRVLAVAQSLIGVREATGHNDGIIVEEILTSAGAEKGDPWCAAFNFYCYSKAGYSHIVPRSAWSPAWVASPTWLRGQGATPIAADTFGIYFSSMGRVAHTGIIEKWGTGSACVTIEGNTNGGGSRDGDGVYRKYRMKSQIYAVRSWFPN